MGIATRKGLTYYKSQVQRILSNPFYIGINRFNGKDYPGAQEPIISRELFERVQRKMHAKRPTRYRQHNPVFKNLIDCSNCGWSSDLATAERSLLWHLPAGQLGL